MSDRIAIGQCIVVLSAREVRAPNARRPHRITPKALGVLLALVRAEGRVVTREELFAGVWAGTAPTNDVLTQAVTQLRKAFAAAKKHPISRPSPRPVTGCWHRCSGWTNRWRPPCRLKPRQQRSR